MIDTDNEGCGKWGCEECYPDDEPQTPVLQVHGGVYRYVTVYDLSRHFGGPEEGGWWYDTGEVIERHIVIAANDAELTERINTLVSRLEEEWPPTGRRFSVLGGDDYRVSVSDEPGADWSNYQPWE